MRGKSSVVLAVLGALLALLGAGLAVGGIWLIALGGSWFYLLAGAALAGIGYGLWRRRAFALWLALALLAASALWAWYEVGTDFWQWVPRFVAFVVIALVVTLATPWLLTAAGQPALAKAPRYLLSLALAGIFVGFIAGMHQPHPAIAASGEQAKVIKADAGAGSGTDWQQYGRSVSGTRYAPFDQINKDNVKDLKVAWTYRTGDLAINGAEFQATPIKVRDTVYLCTPLNKVIALDAESGQEKWKYDPQASTKEWQRCRGVSYFEEPQAQAAAPAAVAAGQPQACQRRIVTTTIDARLITLDADTGVPCADFGVNGAVDLLQGLNDKAKGTYYPTSAPLVAGDVVVTGARVQDNLQVGEPSGVVRGWDVRTGRLLWAWDAAAPKRGTPLPEGGKYADETPNFWGTGAYDAELGLVYIPTGVQTPDFWGGHRPPETEEYATAIVAIDVKTGIDRWHFRTVNHDLWDLDVTAQPILYDRPNADGSVTPMVIQLTKRGQVFVLDRRDGSPVFPIEQRPVPSQGAPEGERLAATQPYSAISVGTDPFEESDMWGATIFDQLYCRVAFKRMRYDGEFTPLNTDTSLIYPGYYGGFNWGGGTLDESTGTLLVNDIRMAQWNRLVPQEKAVNIPFQSHGQFNPQYGTPYGALGSMFVSPLGIPCFKPPFGTMTAIDLTTGKPRWQVPMGTLQDSKVLGVTTHLRVPVGMPTMGGPITTKGGVTFFSGTLDFYVRALDNDTGEELWKERLPVGGQGAPMTYVGDRSGKQFVVLTAGGATRTGSTENRGDYVIAYTLP